MPTPKKHSKLAVSVKNNSKLVVMDEMGYPHIEIRPTHSEGIGPAIQFYRVNGSEPEHLMTLRVAVVGPMVTKIPIVIAAARRLANGSTKPNVKPDSHRP